ncbi:MAG TPA: META domain-containing protein [Actinomycetes bacterium]|nr:META domain-containing protein [Actinomycetes bacterium]
MNRSHLVGLGTVALLALSGCGSTTQSADPASNSDVSGRTYVSHSVDINGNPTALVRSTNLQLSFTDDGISANAGCNSMSGRATIDDDTLVISGGLAMTEMGCESARMDQDQWFADLLTAKPTLSVDGDSLTLDSDGTVIVMTTQPSRVS